MVVVGHSRGTWDEVSLREKDLRILSLTLPPRTRFLGRETPSETKPHSLPLYTPYQIEVAVVVVDEEYNRSRSRRTNTGKSK